MKIKYKTITVHDIITYNALDENLGRAEFDICPVFKNGIIREIFLIRIQQNVNEGFRLKMPKGYNARVFSITSWTHKTEAPKIWRNYWCKDHKAICFQTYVPNNTTKIVFDLHFGNTIDIRFE